MLSINVAKDGWDIFNIIVTIILTFCSLVLIYKCSSIVSDKNKKEADERAALDFLLIVLRRYISYMSAIKNAIRNKINYITYFLEDPGDKEKMKFAFSLIYIMSNFQIDISKYDFTVNSQPSIVDDILLYQELYQEISAGVERLNYTSSMAINIHNPQKIIIKTARDLITRNRDLDTLEVLVSESIVILKRIFDSILRCKQLKRYNNSLYGLLDEKIVMSIKECEQLLESSHETRWKHPLKDIEMRKSK